MAKSTARPELRGITLVRDAVAAWDAYPFSVPAIATLRRIEVTSRVLFFVGENGSGKSTLLEAIALACGFGREGGTRNFSFSTQNDAPSDTNDAERAVDVLADALRLSWGKRQRDGFFLRAESFYNVATYLDRLERTAGGALGTYGGSSLHARSHGESFLTLVLERFSGNGLYLIDEPEAALSAARQLALLARMRLLLARHPATQFIIASHSPIVLAYPGAQICSFDRGRLQPTSYEQTDAYIVTRRFLADHRRALDELFTDDDAAAAEAHEPRASRAPGADRRRPDGSWSRESRRAP